MFKIIKSFIKNRKKKLIMLFFFLSVILIENNWFGQGYLKSINNGKGMIDMKMYLTGQQIYRYLLDLGDVGRSVYMRLLILDFILIISFGLLQTTLIIQLLRRINKIQYKLLIAFPILRGIFDTIENCFLIVNVKYYPYKNTVLLNITSTLIMFKWFMFWLTIITLLVLISLNLKKNLSIRLMKRVLNE